MIVNKDANRECYIGTNLTNIKNPVPSFYKEGATTIPKGSRFNVKLIIPKRGRIYFYNKSWYSLRDIIRVEKGYSMLSGVMAQPINTWREALEVKKQLIKDADEVARGDAKNPDGTPRTETIFKTVIVWKQTQY